MRILLIYLSSFTIFIWPLCPAAQLFPTGINYHVPGIDHESVGCPYRADVEDFNGDGAKDLAVANRVDDSVSIFLGSGDGTFLESETYAVGSGPYHLAAGDLNGDGYPDLAVANRFSDHLSLLFGSGDGSFSPAVTCCSCEGPEWISIEDFDGDGDLDMAVATISNQYMSIFMGDGDGSFQPPVDYRVTELSSDSPSSIAADDFTGDGVLDLAVAHFGRITIFTGFDDGSFERGDTYEIGGWWGYVSAGDLDSDGAADLVYTDRGDSYYSIPPTLVVLLGNGDSTFQYLASHEPGDQPSPAAIHDLNEDGHPDIALTSHDFDGVGIYLGNGDGTVVLSEHYVTCRDVEDVLVADLDGDENADLITINDGCDTITVLPGNGDATFQHPPQFGEETMPYYLLVEDLNGDGNADLVAQSYSQESVFVFVGSSDGSFQHVSTIPAEEVWSTTIGDLNGDGIADIAVGHENDRISIHLGNGDGTFQKPQAQKTDWGPSYLDSGDFDQDGNLDLAYSNYQRDGIGIMMGTGDGSFTSPVQYNAGTNLQSFVVDDFNGDGYLDLVAASEAADRNLSFLLGNGDGSFAIPFIFGAGAYPEAVRSADLDNDGDQDLVVLSDVFLSMPQDDTLAVLLGNGNGTFETSQIHSMGRDPKGVVIEDVNGDGHKDLAVTTGYNHTASQTRSVSLLLGNGDGCFAGRLDYHAPAWPGCLAGSDFDHDGDVDLVAGNWWFGGFSTLYNSSIPQNTVTAGVQCIPSSGTIPFSTAITVYLGNDCLRQDRTVAGSIDLYLADGTVVSDFRSGFSQIPAASLSIFSWSQHIPYRGKVVGMNTFMLMVTDVTAAPFNQPPYPPSGDSSTDICLVSGIAP